jgi:hypothetical protein
VALVKGEGAHGENCLGLALSGIVFPTEKLSTAFNHPALNAPSESSRQTNASVPIVALVLRCTQGHLPHWAMADELALHFYAATNHDLG